MTNAPAENSIDQRLQANTRSVVDKKAYLRYVLPPDCDSDPLVQRLLDTKDRNFFIDHSYRAFLGRPATAREILFHARCLRFFPRFFTRERLIAKLRSSPESIAYQLSRMANRLNNLEISLSNLEFTSGATAGFVATRALPNDSRP